MPTKDSPTLKTNIILCGDNLERLTEIPDNSIDLIYADPPFFSNKHYEIIWNDGAELRAFQDRWRGGINQYIRWMRPRIAECHRVLKDTGSMYLHCDWHANAHLRIQLDNIFGSNHFRNEIIWHYTGGGRSKTYFSSKHDTIYLYSKNDHPIFNIDAIRTPYKQSSGYAHGGIVAKSGKKYMPHPDGTPIDDVWDVPIINPLSKERIGYPTQKPETLLKRIIEASSNQGDIVLDPFCGCGTTIAVAQQLGRKWIGIDVSPTACEKMAKRLNNIGVSVEIDGMPETIEHLKALEPFMFQGWVISRIQGTPNNKKTGDMGIDGWTFTNHEPIQIKRSSNVGRNVVDNFETAIRRTRQTYGEIYAFSFLKSAYEEAARAQNDDGIEIKLIKVEELLPNSTMKSTEKQKSLL